MADAGPVMKTAIDPGTIENVSIDASAPSDARLLCSASVNAPMTETGIIKSIKPKMLTIKPCADGALPRTSLKSAANSRVMDEKLSCSVDAHVARPFTAPKSVVAINRAA